MGKKPDSESKIWRLTGSGFLVFGAGSGFGVNFSDSAHLWFAVLLSAIQRQGNTATCVCVEAVTKPFATLSKIWPDLELNPRTQGTHVNRSTIEAKNFYADE